jgi:type IV secretory pathway VirD2 relaxase
MKNCGSGDGSWEIGDGIWAGIKTEIRYQRSDRKEKADIENRCQKSEVSRQKLKLVIESLPKKISAKIANLLFWT